MGSEITLRQLEAGDSLRVVKLHRKTFTPEETALTIFGAAGVARYLASLISFSEFQDEHRLWGAWYGADLVGYAHFRALPDSWHLNHIAVEPSFQGAGIGRMLWERFVQTAQDGGFKRLSLDVEADNQRVIRWYERRGLRVADCQWRYERKLQFREHNGLEEEPIRLIGWDQGEAWQHAYGFSSFQLRYRGQSWLIGRLAERFFRISRLLPEALEAALWRLDPKRCLLIFSDKPLDFPDLKPRGRSLRMVGEIWPQSL